ncbi:DNA oxidative demethylase ALKBH2 [Armadillidium nasatum]|uniref:DNA oxidative demethylase ALKBH2 n=1 Tax=Armadillidium nasatum TaxID=96803 RepID=A0A5N5TCJ0_9CRUS|nr:DNA oxidative demethylase ALKBH2 [Armadillidium nasatum]
MLSSKRKLKQETLESEVEIKQQKLSSNTSENLDSILGELIQDGFPNWKKITAESLDLDYALILPAELATYLFNCLESSLEYFTGDLAKIKIFGKVHDLPRKQVTFGDEGLTYKYSGIVTPALPWPPIIASLKNFIYKLTGYNYNFVLVNRYKDGQDKIGEHKDDEKDLDPDVPIASVSLGQERDFYFKHKDARNETKRDLGKVSMRLEHGSLLLMNKPTNQYWYHALPPRKGILKPRINLTFRKIIKNPAIR